MRLRFATLNVWALTWPIGRSVAARMEAIGSALPGLALDAIAFQEVWRQDARDALIAAGWRAGLREFWFDADDSTSGGLLLLSRAPIGSASFTPYALRGRAHRIWHADYYGRKGFLLCTLDTAAGPVALAVTHLHAQYREGAHPEYATYRAAQVVELASALRDVRDPLITAGDFNFEEASPEYRVWTGLAGVADAAILLDRREPTVLSDHPYTAPPGRDERIDYLFVRPGIDRGARVLEVERVFDTPPPEIAGVAAYSDHCGVLAEIDVAAPGAPSRDPDPRSLEEAAALLLGHAAFFARTPPG